MAQTTQTFPIYASTLKSCKHEAFHLSTFNNMLQNPQILPKYIREEKIEKKLVYVAPDLDDPLVAARPSVPIQDNELLQGAKKTSRFVFVEPKSDYNQRETNKYLGEDSTTFAGHIKTRARSERVQKFLPENNFDQSNYALLIFDKQNQCFRMAPVNRHLHFEMEKVQKISFQKNEQAKRLFADKERFFAEKPDKKKGSGAKRAPIFAKLGKRGRHAKSKEEGEEGPQLKRVKTNKVYNDYGEEMSNDSREVEEQDDDYNHNNADINENSDDARAYDEKVDDGKDEYESDQSMFDTSGKLRKQGEKEAEKPKKAPTKEELVRNKKQQEKFMQEKQRQFEQQQRKIEEQNLEQVVKYSSHGSEELFDDDEDDGGQQEALSDFEKDSLSEDDGAGSQDDNGSEDAARNGGLPKAKQYYS